MLIDLSFDTDVTKTGNQRKARETGKWKTKTKQRIGNEVTNRAEVYARFCSHFSFFRSPLLVLVTSSSILKCDWLRPEPPITLSKDTVEPCMVTWTLKVNEKQFELEGNTSFRGKFQRNCNQEKGKLVRGSTVLSIFRHQTSLTDCFFAGASIVLMNWLRELKDVYFKIPTKTIFYRPDNTCWLV